LTFQKNQFHPHAAKIFTLFCNLSFGAAAFSPGISYLTACIMYGSKYKLGVALVGLGSYARYELAPALQQTKNCHLAGIDRNACQRAGVG